MKHSWQVGYHGNNKRSVTNLWNSKFCKCLFGKSHQVSRLWLVSFWSSEQFTGLEVENTPPPGMNRVKSPATLYRYFSSLQFSNRVSGRYFKGLEQRFSTTPVTFCMKELISNFGFETKWIESNVQNSDNGFRIEKCQTRAERLSVHEKPAIFSFVWNLSPRNSTLSKNIMQISLARE